MSAVPTGMIESQAPSRDITSVQSNSPSETFVTIGAQPGETLIALLTRAAQKLQAHPARVLSLTIFNGRTQYTEALQQLPKLFGDVTWPVTLLHSELSLPDKPAGVEIHALSDPLPELRPISLRGRIVGNTWEDDYATYCVLQDLRAEAVEQTPAAQTQRVLDDMLDALEQAGMTFQQVYRTWFRNKDILSWYNDFNRVRTAFFNQHHVFDGLLPASTGISASNPYGAALVAGVWAMKPKSPLAIAQVVDSPLQDSACRYGSSFSRAVEVQRGALHHVTVSGTASIGRDGKTVHVGDTHAQIELTMRVVHAILRGRGMDWTNVVRGLAYFRHAAEIGAYAQWAQAHGVTLPVIEVNHTVCRDDLLYEIELDAEAIRG